MSKTKLAEEIILVIGQSGSDGGYRVLTPHGVIKVPSNNPEATEVFSALSKSFAKLQSIAAKVQVAE